MFGLGRDKNPLGYNDNIVRIKLTIFMTLISPNNKEISQKIYQVFRSLYRLVSFEKMSASEIIIEHEKAILTQRFQQLSLEEFILIATQYHQYSINTEKEETIQDHHFLHDLKKEFQSLN